MLFELLETYATSAAVGSLVFFVPLWGPKIVFGTFGKSPARLGQNPKVRSYSLTDLFVVISFLACGNAILSALRSQLPQHIVIYQVICLNTLVLSVWIQCQQFMRSWAIDQTRQRVLMQVVLYPVAILAVGQIIFTSIQLVSMLGLAADEGLGAYVQHQMVWSAAFVLIMALIFVALTRRGFLTLMGNLPAQIPAAELRSPMA